MVYHSIILFHTTAKQMTPEEEEQDTVFIPHSSPPKEVSEGLTITFTKAHVIFKNF